MKEKTVKAAYIQNEGDDLFYKVRGKGLPLVLVPPAGGNGDQYLPLADCLAEHYKVFTYDRRANARSSMNFPLHFDINQQSRDILAILKAENESKAFIFGNSSGAVIALNMLETLPNHVYSAILHEPPLAQIHNEAETWNKFFEKCYFLSSKYHAYIGIMYFFAGIQMPIFSLIKSTKFAKEYAEKEINFDTKKAATTLLAAEVLMKYELLQVVGYKPNFEKIKKTRIPIFVAQSQYGIDKKTWYAQVGEALAMYGNCHLETFPGHHGSFMDMPEVFAEKIHNIFQKIKS